MNHRFSCSVTRDEQLFAYSKSMNEATHRLLIAHFEEADPAMAELAKSYGPLSHPTVKEPFEALTGAIVSQQLSTKAAATIFRRFCDVTEQQLRPQRILELDDEEFAMAGISRQKRSYLRALAEHFIQVPDDRDWHLETDDALISELTSIKGIGVWTVQMFLIFHLLREDVFPIDDLGVRNGMVRLYRLNENGKELRLALTDRAEKWRPYRSAACRYIWRYYEDTA